MSEPGPSDQHLNASSNANGNSLPKEQLKIEIDEHMDLGKQKFDEKEFGIAIEHFSQGVHLTEQLYGQFSIELAESMFMYGNALLENAKETASLISMNHQPPPPREHDTPIIVKKTSEIKLDGAVEDEDESEEGDEEDYSDEEEEEYPQIDMKRKVFSFGADIDLEDDEEEEEEPEAQDDAGEDEDFELAWQTLDTVRFIYIKQLENTNSEKSDELKQLKIKLSEVLLTLGDVSMETENFSQAIIDYQQAVDTLDGTVSSHDSALAEAIYKLALAYEYLPDRPRAQAEIKKILKILEDQISELNPEDPKEKIKIEETKELLQDMTSKLSELQQPLAEFLNTLATNLMNNDAEASSNAKDVNKLVKRKVGSEEKADNLKKKKE